MKTRTFYRLTVGVEKAPFDWYLVRIIEHRPDDEHNEHVIAVTQYRSRNRALKCAKKIREALR